MEINEEVKQNVEHTCNCQNHEHQCNHVEDANCSCGENCSCNGQDNKLVEEINKLTQVNNELVEKVKLAQAELVNYRRRKDEETASLLKYANQDLILELIQVVDNFERAIKLDDNNLTDELSKFLVGFKMMYANLTDILRKFGVEEISRQGQIFDPSLEQALVVDSVDEYEDDVVLEVLLKGYKLKDRVIRPASVKINQK